MSVHHLRTAAALAALAGLASTGFAADAAEESPDTKALLEYIKRLESRVDELEREREWPLESFRGQSGSVLEAAIASINWSGHIEVLYSYNFRHGGDIEGVRGDTLGFNQLRSDDADESTFRLQHVQLLVDRPLTSVGSTGFRVRVDGGVEGGGFFDDGVTTGFTSDGSTDVDVEEAYMSWRADLGGMGQDCLTYADFSAGKFYSPLGLEQPENLDNWTITRNPIYSYTAIHHTGIRAEVPLSECLKVTGWLVNGWDNNLDDNDSKTGILQVEFGPYAWMESTLTLNGSWGEESSVQNHSGDKTRFLEAIWKGRVSEDTELAVDAIWAEDEHGLARMLAVPSPIPLPGVPTGDPNNSTDLRTRAVAVYARHHYTDRFWIGGRLGYFHQTMEGIDLRLLDATIAVGYEVAEGLTVALEYRHDHARGGQEPFFGPNEEEIADQDTLTASFLYRF